jgi:hypothetical protein
VPVAAAARSSRAGSASPSASLASPGWPSPSFDPDPADNGERDLNPDSEPSEVLVQVAGFDTRQGTPTPPAV